MRAMAVQLGEFGLLLPFVVQIDGPRTSIPKAELGEESLRIVRSRLPATVKYSAGILCQQLG